ncbi:MAG: SDR family NAD(P)-dependent oxidoreductase [Chitinophagaceae bacterium]|nr:SDR family NAD(P)-dependent oxidoreductase [Chitinophagaceae bacterium]
MAGTVIITGANGNLGVAAVKKFLDTGYKVIAVDHNGTHLGFAAAHDNFELKDVNLSDEAAAEDFITEAISLYGRIDGALLLVGGFAMGDVAATDGAAMKEMYTLNFETAWFAARPLFQHMLQNGFGRLVFMGARTALKPELGKGAIAYALTKSMLFNLADLLNASAKGKNVLASVVAPGTIDTALNHQSMPGADSRGWIEPAQLADILELICSGKEISLR